MADPFSQVLGAYRAAVLAKDVEAFVALYEDDVEVFDAWGIWSLRGLSAWRALVTDWFSSLGAERVVIDVAESRTTRSGELAVGHAILTYTARSAGGEALRSLGNRLTMGLRWSGSSWRVFHEHTSVPIDHRSTKAILQRPGSG
jgi:uncharacterized protein (TIGR02246 family)